MNANYLSLCQAWFEEYASRFHSPNQEIEKNIALKLKHTIRVRDNISRIADSHPLNQKGAAMAEALALFHDVGRFEQLKQYGGFDDRIKDHAALGIMVLNRAGILRGLPEGERHLLQRVIWLHNKYEIPETEKGDSLLFARLLRDADKLDILGIIVEHIEMRDSNPNKALDFGLGEKKGFSREAVDAISKGKMVRIAELRNLNDMRLMYLSWVFDINFPFTLSCIEERGYLEKLQIGLLQDREICRAVDFISAYLQERRSLQERKRLSPPELSRIRA
jgi:HD superfamily phosphodiesterase